MECLGPRDLKGVVTGEGEQGARLLKAAFWQVFATPWGPLTNKSKFFFLRNDHTPESGLTILLFEPLAAPWLS